MKNNSIFKVIKKPLSKNIGLFILVSIALLVETGISLFIPNILSQVIDNLENKTEKWLFMCTLFFCFIVIMKGVIGIFNTYLREKLGWYLCDCLRENMFQRIFSFSVKQHKSVRMGEFLERLEGDVNILVGFFSSMFIDIAESLLMVIGILVVFYTKSVVLGIAFTVLSLAILLLFVLTQNAIAALWREVRAKETEVLGEFSQDIAAWQDVVGIGRERYILERFTKKFEILKRKRVKASFKGNIPATIFYSMLNVGEGIVLVVGVYLMSQGSMTLGGLYLILSYVGMLNIPFASLKYEFAELPQVLSAIGRIGDVYKWPCETRERGSRVWDNDNRSVTFEQVSFGYNRENIVLDKVSFQVESGEHILIEGRTGSGKSTILQLIAGLYTADEGSVKVGGYAPEDYRTDSYYRGINYILQSNPILEDTIRNNVSRYQETYTDQEILSVLKKVHLDRWVEESDKGLSTVINSGDISQDVAQLLAWAAVLLVEPKVLLVDEFDGSIQDATIQIIDKVICQELTRTTIIMVTHKRRSTIEFQKEIKIESGKILEIVPHEKGVIA
ncbi:MAG: ABC transporter ATP-binding protein [Lacrimispora saccharolytica]